MRFPSTLPVLCVPVSQVDLFKEAKLEELYMKYKDTKIGFGTKPQALIYGWERGILPEHVLYLDVDVIVVHTTEEFSLNRVFEPLQVRYCSVVIVMEV